MRSSCEVFYVNKTYVKLVLIFIVFSITFYVKLFLRRANDENTF